VKLADAGLVKRGTNAPGGAAVSKTNLLMASRDTNAVTVSKAKENASNAAPVQVVAESASTNIVGTNVAVGEMASTNSAPTNLVASHSAETIAAANDSAATNVTGTNLTVTQGMASSNVTAMELAKAGNTNSTNSASAKKGGAKKPPMMPPPMFGGMPGMKAPSLPPEIQARVDRVTESEILGPVNHPMPMALLGIAGKVAFLRSPSGQTGLVKEGDDLGEIKLVRIGVNRVLVEQDGQKKELMIFSGFGGETLVPKSTDTFDETTKN
jgi:hypothetical protein